MSIVLNGDSGITTPTYNGTVTAEYSVPVTSFKNRIINGNMTIDQRNAGASVTVTSGGYTLDRFDAVASATSKYSVQQNAGSVTTPVGFKNYLGVTSLSAYTVGATQNFGVRQMIEGFNCADLAWGTANAQTVTLSFWVRSSLTGTFGGALANAGATRSYPFTYTISAANTWEYKTVTIAGDTTGTWATDNSIGIRVNFGLGSGSSATGPAGSWAGADYFSASSTVSVVGTNGATFYITGVQLEKGSTATSFDYRPYGQEMAMCQRYYVQYFGTSLYEYAPSYLNGFNTTNAYGWIQVPVPMRTSPSVSASTFLINDETAAKTGTSLAIYTVGQSNKLVSVLAQAASGITVNRAYNLVANNSTSAYIQISSEL